LFRPEEVLATGKWMLVGFVWFNRPIYLFACLQNKLPSPLIGLEMCNFRSCLSSPMVTRPLIISVSLVSELAILGHLFFWFLVDGLPAAVFFQFLYYYYMTHAPLGALGRIRTELKT
jgi:hypothetical protein